MLKPIGLFILSGLFLAVAFYSQHWHEQRFNIENLREEISANVAQESASIERLANQFERSNQDIWLNKDIKYPFFLVDSVQILKWTDNSFLPDLRLLQDDFQWKFYRTQRGSFLIFKKMLSGASFLMSYIPLNQKFGITNRYLSSTWNDRIFPTAQIQLVAPDEAGLEIRIGDKVIFKVIKGPAGSDLQTNSMAILLLLASIALVIASLFILLNRLHRKQHYLTVFGCMILAFISLRLLMLMLNLPHRWTASPLFDPQVFASSSYNASIGDLFINALGVFACCIYLFTNCSRFRLLQSAHHLKGLKKYLIGSLALLICYFSFLFPFLFIETLVHNSSISLDITQSLQFDFVRILAWASVIVGTISAFLFTHSFFRLAMQIAKDRWKNFCYHLITAVIIFIAYSLIMERNYWLSVLIASLYFTLLFFTKWYTSISRANPSTFLYLLLTAVVFSVQASVSIARFADEKSIQSQFRFAQNYLISRDILGEYLLDQAAKRINQDPFIQGRMSNPFLNRGVVRQKIRQFFLSSYFDRYEAGIYLYGPSGNALDVDSRDDFATMVKKYQDDANKTDYENIYFVNPTSDFIKQYVAIVPVERSGAKVGFIVLDLFLKKIIPHNVYPELLVDNRFSQFFSTQNFSYAFYRDKTLEGQYGEYNYKRNFDGGILGQPVLYTQGVSSNDYLHIAIEDDFGRVAVVSGDQYPVFSVLTNFAIQFVIGLMLILIGFLIYNFSVRRRGQSFNYSFRIQLYIYLAFVLPLLMVTFTVLMLMRNSNEQAIKNDYAVRATMYAERISALIKQLSADSVNSGQNLSEQLLDLSRLTSIDASVFDANGLLKATTQPQIYESQLVSNLINPTVFNTIINQGGNSVMADEHIGKLNFSSAYEALRDPVTGKILGILSIPFFDSLASSERAQINTMAIILTIFVGIFILFSVLSVYAVNWLTFPLRYITRTLSATTLSGQNKRMEWGSDDEIGLMVKEYNKMVDNLEQSKIDLARTQKETAWREMAQQVAHEIKNPLTPMKLTLQQLQFNLVKSEIDPQKLEASLTSLLNQVEILNDIASSFSSFARMPAPELQKLELNSLIKKSVDLFSTDGIEINFQERKSPIHILGDDQLLTRIFFNLLLNGKQAVPSNRKAKIDIEIGINDRFCRVSFHDNGTGIDSSIREKIFIPHFSTKKSGSGLGLAIAKQAIEQSGGKIWFETDSEKGTTFFLEIPIAASII